MRGVEVLSTTAVGSLALLAALGLLLAAVGSAAADSPFDPVKDDPALPRVLLIGDSISIGYTVPVRQMLRGRANVHRIPENGQYSSYGLAHIDEWLGDGRWDVIHSNWGIWDTHFLDTSGDLITDADEPKFAGKSSIRTPIPEYQANLHRLIDRLERTGAKLIWASTTPLTCRAGDRARDIGRYNAAAAAVMRQRHVAVNDLCSCIAPHLDRLQSDDGCHFTPEGSDYLAARVAGSIAAALREPERPGRSLQPREAGRETVEGRKVIRFEHACLPEWGYKDGGSQYFYVVEPARKTKGPLLVCLHSAGGDGKSEMPPNVLKVDQAGDEFTGLILNSGSGTEWWWGAEGIKQDPEAYRFALTPVENRVLATIDWVAQKYGIDRDRIYLRGISMGGSGTLGIGMSHGDIFAALLAGVPAGTEHALHRIRHSLEPAAPASSAPDCPPIMGFFSHKDSWSKGMEGWLDTLRREKLPVVAAWGPWGHENHYEMTNPAAYEFPWLTLRRNQAYPVFTDASSDDTYPGLDSDGPDQDGQINAFFRWNVKQDRTDRFAMEIRLVRSDELHGITAIPQEAVADVTLRRLQQFAVSPGNSCWYAIRQSGRTVRSGLLESDSHGLLTIDRVSVTGGTLDLILSH